MNMKDPSEGARCRPTATSVPPFGIVLVLESIPALLVRRVPRRDGELKTESSYHGVVVEMEMKHSTEGARPCPIAALVPSLWAVLIPETFPALLVLRDSPLLGAPVPKASKGDKFPQ